MEHTILKDAVSITGKKWILKQYVDREVQGLAERHGISDVIARLLITRNIDDLQVKDFLTPTLRSMMNDPWQLLDMQTGVQRIIVAIQNKESIAIFGDYDVDGATSTALLMRFFDAYGLKARFHIPDRITEGYGPNIVALQKLKDLGVSLVITVDCGTTAYEVLAEAKQCGLDIIVVDHHIGEPRQPEAVAIINPNRFDQPDNPYKNCAAVGIAFIVAAAVRSRLREIKFDPIDPSFDLMNLLDLVAVGTVCDVVALTGINRAFVTQGLKVLAHRQNMGLNALMDCAKVDQTPGAYHLGFMIGPRINAGGRVGQSDLGVKLLTTRDPSRATLLANQLNEFNIERQAIEKVALNEAMDQGYAQQDSCVIVAASHNWHPGVIGIIAGRLKDRFNRPAFVISFDAQNVGKGSARSVSGLDLGSLIQSAKQVGLITNGGGHAMAGGITIDHAQLNYFTEFLIQRIMHLSLDLTPTTYIDSYLNLSAATFDFVDSLTILEPHGQSNPKPRFIFDNVFVSYSSIVGQEHLRVTLKSYDGQTLNGMAFRSIGTLLERYLGQTNGQLLAVVGTLKLDTWMGKNKITLMIDDVAVM